MPVQIVASREQGAGGSLPGKVSLVRPSFVGRSLGKETLSPDYAKNYDSSDDSPNLHFFSPLGGGTAYKILRISPLAGDSAYIYQPEEYSFETPNKIRWRDIPLSPPELSVAVSSTGGSLTAGTASYSMTFIDNNNGETLVGNSVAVNLTGSTNKLTFSFGAQPFHLVTAGKLYRTIGVTVTAKDITLEEVAEGKVTLTSSSGFTSAVKPVTANAFTKPSVDGATYYITYTYPVFDYEPKTYDNIGDVEKDHGLGSELTNAARVAFDIIKCPEVYLCAVVDDTLNSYQTAINKLDNKDTQYLVALKDSISLGKYVVNRANYLSGDLKQKERFGVVCPPDSYTSLGDTTTPGTILHWLASYNNNPRAILPVGNGNALYAEGWWQLVSGLFTENYKVPNYIVAAAYAAICCTVEDVASSVTNMILPGFNFGPAGGPWADDLAKAKVEAAGGVYLEDSRGNALIYHDITNDTTTTENQERSIRAAEDEMRKLLRNGHSEFKGKKLITNRKAAIYQKTVDILSLMVRDSLINSFRDPSVQQDSNTKTRINIRFKYQPVYPINEIFFIYSFDLTTLV